ncbi:MAG TPA: hypothetical protein VND64_23575 [Pirellulales bacterium]|nr:hypothetical protein [Pirellulales bacterium]
MPTSLSAWIRAVALVTCVALVSGCGPAAPAASGVPSQPTTEANGKDVPITDADVKMPEGYAEAVERIDGYCETVRKAIEDGHPHGAHRALDEMDIVLNRLPEIARDGGVPKRHWEQVVVAGEEIRDLLNEIHAAIDDNRAPDYAAVANRVDAALASLAEVSRKTTD